MPKSRSRRKHVRKAFIEFNRRGPWTDEERREWKRKIHRAANSTGSAIAILPAKKVVVSKSKPKPEPRRNSYGYGYRNPYSSRRSVWDW